MGNPKIKNRELSNSEIEEIRNNRKSMQCRELAKFHNITVERVKDICKGIFHDNYQTVFTAKQLIEIKEDRQTMTLKKLAAKWGCSRGTITNILDEPKTERKPKEKPIYSNIFDEKIEGFAF